MFQIGRTRSFFEKYDSLRRKLKGLREFFLERKNITDVALEILDEEKSGVKVFYRGWLCYIPHKTSRAYDIANDEVNYLNEVLKRGRDVKQ